MQKIKLRVHNNALIAFLIFHLHHTLPFSCSWENYFFSHIFIFAYHSYISSLILLVFKLFWINSYSIFDSLYNCSLHTLRSYIFTVYLCLFETFLSFLYSKKTLIFLSFAIISLHSVTLLKYFSNYPPNYPSCSLYLNKMQILQE